MIYLVIGMSVLFVSIGFILTENNAKYLLSGYNTMSEEDKKLVDIKAYIPYFRRFHILLGMSFLVIGLALTYLINKNAGGVFLGVYPIIAYIYFIWSSSKYFKGSSKKWNRVGIIILSGTLVFVISLFAIGFKEDKLFVSGAGIEFEGSYGEQINLSEIQSIELVNQLPKIILKTDGFALGTINKGYFKTSQGEVVKLILNSDARPLILLTKENGQKIYYSSRDKPNEQLFNELKKTLPKSLFLNKHNQT